MAARSRRRIWRERYLERVLAELPRGRMSNAAVADLVRTTWDTAFIEGRRDGADAADHYAAERDKVLALTRSPDGEPTGLDWLLALNRVDWFLRHAVVRVEMQTRGGQPRAGEVEAARRTLNEARDLVEQMRDGAGKTWFAEPSEVAS